MAGQLRALRNRMIRAVLSTLSQTSPPLLDTDPSLDPELVAMCRAAAAEGAVLLKNDGALPFADDIRVAVFGRVQLDYFVVGYGSGGDVKAPYRRDLLDGLRDCQVNLDEDLAGVYTNWCAANRPDEGFWGNWPLHYEEMPLDTQLVQASASRTDTAIVVIGRAAGESRDSKLKPGSYYLTDAERAMLDMVTTHFERTVVVLDCGNVIDLSWIDSYGSKISAVLLAWQGGMESGTAVADVLSGKVNPSGKLTDTIAFEYADYPTSDNFGGRKHNTYAEDIFVGYRYFETFAPRRVQFPFGFGLSYTSFSVAASAVIDDEVRVTATVTNTGSLAGKETVQVYFRAPDGCLAKPARSLAAFAKTALIEPGESQSLAISFPVSQMASYDDAGSTGHRSAYVLEAGDYELFVGTDVRTAAQIATHTLDTLTVTRQLTEACAADPAHPFSRMTLARHNGVASTAWEAAPTATADRPGRVLAAIPPSIPTTGDRGITLLDVASERANLDEFIAQLSPVELEALSRGDVIMGSPLGTPGNAGVFGGTSESLRAKGVPPITASDGPSGIRLAAYASLLPCGTALASTWNPTLVRELAALHGQEMVHKGSDVLLSPGMNIHRDPLCGRNFEYFSEDPVVTGKVGAAVIAGIQQAGVSACPKHFAANNQETNRNKNDSRVSERALREIYLRGFEICISEARPQTLMTSYNKINGVWAHYNYELNTTILREEWGFEGVVMTDWWMQRAVDPYFPEVSDNAYRVRAQVDILMPGSVGGIKRDKTDTSLLDSHAKTNGITLGELQRSARNVLRFALISRPMQVLLAAESADKSSIAPTDGSSTAPDDGSSTVPSDPA